MKVSNFKLWNTRDGRRCFTYGDPGEYEKAQYISEIPSDKWLVSEWCELCRDILEDANRHSMTDIADAYVQRLRAAKLSEETILTCIREFTLMIEDGYS